LRSEGGKLGFQLRSDRILSRGVKNWRKNLVQWLVGAVARGYAWRQRLLNGHAHSIAEIAQKEGITRRYVARILQLGFLAPDIIAAVLANRLPVRITVDRLHGPIPLDWNEQRRLFGFDAAGGTH
jgi:site-specific DNA recombinase